MSQNRKPRSKTTVYYSVEDSLKESGFGFQQWFMLFTCGLYWSADAMQLMIASYLIPALEEEWNISELASNLTAAVVFMGIAIGTYLCGICADRYGRRPTYAVSASLTGLIGIASCFAPNLAWLLVLRTAMGIALGGAPSAFGYFSEFLDTKMRGRVMVWFELFWTFGTLSEALLAYFLMEKHGWRWLMFISSVPILLLLVCVPFMPESPRYYIARNRPEKAAATLALIARRNGKSLPPGELYIPEQTVKTRLKAQRFGSSLIGIFSKRYLLSTLLLWIIWTVNSFVYYGLVIFQTGYFKTLTSSAYLVTLITSGAEVPGILICAFVVDLIGRRATKAAFFFACGAASLLLLTPSIPMWVIVTLASVARMSILGAYAAVYIYTPELYHSAVRGTGLSAAAAMAKVASIVAPFLALPSSPAVTLIIYGVLSFVGCAAAAALPIETKGMELLDFEDEKAGKPRTVIDDSDLLYEEEEDDDEGGGGGGTGGVNGGGSGGGGGDSASEGDGGQATSKGSLNFQNNEIVLDKTDVDERTPLL